MARREAPESSGWDGLVDLEREDPTLDSVVGDDTDENPIGAEPFGDDDTDEHVVLTGPSLVDDPVLAAIGELDGSAAAHRAAAKSIQEPATEPEAPLPKSTTRPKALRLAAPESSKKVDASAADAVRDALTEGSGSTEWAPGRPGSGPDKRVVFGTIGAAVVMVVALWVFSRDAPVEPTAPEPPARAAAPSSKAPAPPTPEPAVEAPPSTANTIIRPKEAPEPERAAPKAAVPMLSVTSSPPGAMVEINGLVRGKTPLVITSPERTPSIRIRLTLDKHRTWEGAVEANEAGHYAKRVELTPR